MATSPIKRDRQLIVTYITKNVATEFTLESNRSYEIIVHTPSVCTIGIARVSGTGDINYIPVHENGNITIAYTRQNTLTVTSTADARGSALEIYGSL